jgi:hypothetical protein
MMTVQTSPRQFYAEYLMARSRFEPRDFGVDMERDEFMDKMVDEFNATYRGTLSIDELCLRPRVALRFCDDVRQRTGFYDAPDDIILRSIMNRRKSPNT